MELINITEAEDEEPTEDFARDDAVPQTTVEDTEFVDIYELNSVITTEETEFESLIKLVIPTENLTTAHLVALVRTQFFNNRLLSDRATKMLR